MAEDTKTEDTKYRQRSISMPPDLAEWAEDRADALGFDNFSAYIAQLIRQDRIAGGPLVIRETNDVPKKKYP